MEVTSTWNPHVCLNNYIFLFANYHTLPLRDNHYPDLHVNHSLTLYRSIDSVDLNDTFAFWSFTFAILEIYAMELFSIHSSMTCHLLIISFRDLDLLLHVVVFHLPLLLYYIPLYGLYPLYSRWTLGLFPLFCNCEQC